MELIIILVCLLVSGFFSGSEIAYFSLSEAKLYALVRRKVKGADLVYKLRSSPERLLVTILVGNNIVNIGMASYTTVWVTKTLGTAAVGVATGIITLLVLMFGEIFPKSIGQRFSQTIAFATAWPLYILMLIMTPVTIAFEVLTKVVNSLFADSKPTAVQTEDELKAMSLMGFQSGHLEDFEHDVIQKIFNLNDIMVHRAMTPISRVFMLRGDLHLGQVTGRIRSKHFSRIPVCDNQNRITGFLYLKDIIRVPRELWEKKTVRQLQRRILHVRDTKILSELYEDFTVEQIHIAAAHDVNGKVVGIITIEDILEELLGEIEDETDLKTSSKRRLQALHRQSPEFRPERRESRSILPETPSP